MLDALLSVPVLGNPRFFAGSGARHLSMWVLISPKPDRLHIGQVTWDTFEADWAFNQMLVDDGLVRNTSWETRCLLQTTRIGWSVVLAVHLFQAIFKLLSMAESH